MTVVVVQRPATSLDDVAVQLREAFAKSRTAVASAERVVFVVAAPDLLGQGTIEDAAVAGGFLGLMRAIVFEGARAGWQANTVAVAAGVEPDAGLLELAANSPWINGQVLNTDIASIGKVVP